jgi:predicted CoA-substrate-specific enzyme activase
MNADPQKITWKNAVGICLGASTISLVEVVESDNEEIRIKNVITREHDGDPKGVLSRILDEYELNEKYLAATGRKFREVLDAHSITEPEATEIAYEYVNKNCTPFDAVVSAGGETFVVYEIDRKGKIAQVSSGNKCASGTGEFFLQQIRRMNIDIDKAVELSQASENPHMLSGRCSVFCKSDCTHALNKGVPIGDVAAGLSHMIAKKIEELLVKIGAKKAMVVGGTAQNPSVISYLRDRFELVEVPADAPYFEALGAALYALATKQSYVPAKGHYYREVPSSFTFHKPLSEFETMVEFKDMPRQKPQDGDTVILGLDVGSTTTKAVLFRTADEKILASIYLRTNGNPIEASRNCYKGLLKETGNTKLNIVGVGVTGSGRYIAGLHADTEGIINEIIAHARAAAHFDREVDTIFEIGGQDAKYTYLTNSVASDYAMNEACSAGTGSFLEESAYESLGIKMEDIAPIAMLSKKPPNFSDQCAAFISSDIKTAFQEGLKREDIVAGLVYSICLNYLNRVKGSRQTGGKIFMQGGVCYNKAIPIAMAALSGKKIIVPPEPGLMGAYGVALEIKNLIEIGLLKSGTFDLADLADRDVSYGKEFICQGKAENCDRKCEISMITVKGKQFPFGGACNKYYNQIHGIKNNVTEFNHVVHRTPLLYHKFTTPRPDFKADAPVIGLNRSFHMNTLYPMYFNFFNELGCKVVISDKVRQSGIDKAMTSLCLSSQIALGMFEDLLDKKPDYIFMPQLIEMHVSDQESYRKEFQTVCMFVQGEPFMQKATFLHDADKPVMITPPLNFMRGWDAEEATFIKVAEQIGFTAEEGRRAHKVAVEKQMEFFRALKEEGKKVLEMLEKDKTQTAVVLFGHPYNAFADEANKGVPFKFASRGVHIIPFDFLLYEDEENFRNTYWEMGQRIIKAARIVERHPQLFGAYLTNFLCAIDSMMVPHFRDLMAQKPSLTIEVDSHTADAGVNTRIEAFMDVIKNYLKVKDTFVQKTADYKMAYSEVDALGRAWLIDSNGERFTLTDPKVKAVCPSMGDLFAGGIAACLRSIGLANAEALPVCDREALDLGRSVTTGKECLPIINIVGEMLHYLKHRKNPNEKLALFMVDAGGCCRVGQYAILLRTVMEKLQIRDVALVLLANDNGYAGLGLPFRLAAAKAVYIGDVLDDVRSAIKAMAVDKEAGMRIFGEEVRKIWASFNKGSKIKVYQQLKLSAKVFKNIKLVQPIKNAKYVGVMGEIFVRRDHHSLMGIPEKLAENGFVMLDAPVTEWIRYVDFLLSIKHYERQVKLAGQIEAIVGTWVQDYHERKVKKIMASTGLYEYELIHIKKYMQHSRHIFPYTLTGEPGLSTGAALYHLADKYCGVINIGPFGCMNSRMTEAVSTPDMTVEGKEKAAKLAGHPVDLTQLKENIDILPFLSIETDGNPFSQILQARMETFMLQANRLHEGMMQMRKSGKSKH